MGIFASIVFTVFSALFIFIAKATKAASLHAYLTRTVRTINPRLHPSGKTKKCKSIIKGISDKYLFKKP
jgi:hypothetical protein